MRVFSGLLTIAFCLVLTVHESAIAGTKGGDVELGFYGAYSHMSADGQDADSIIGAGKIGYFFSDAFQIGLVFTGTWMSPDDSDDSALESHDTTMIYTEFELNYHFLTEGTFVPYIGPHVGVVWTKYGSEDETNVDYGGHIGIKSFFSERGSFDTQFRYTRYDGFQDTSVDEMRLQIGINLYF